MAIKSSDLKYIAVKVTEAIYTKVVADAEYKQVVTSSVGYKLPSVGNYSLEYSPGNQIVKELLPVVEQAVFTLSKNLEDSATLTDTSVYSFSKDLANDVVEVLETFVSTYEKNVTDVATLTEIIVVELRKVFAEYVTLGDNSSFWFNKPANDILTTLDSINRYVTFVRKFSDYVAIDDLSNIDKYFGGNKFNIATVSDRTISSLNKVITDSAVLSDLNRITAHKTLQDTATLLESLSLDVLLVSQDTSLISDLIAFENTKIFNDIATSTDLRQISYSKILDDLVNSLDTIQVIAQFVRTFSNIVSIQDNANTSTIKALTEVFNTVDNLAITASFARDFTETLLTLEHYSNTITKPISDDSLLLSDNVAYEVIFNRSFFDFVAIDDLSLVDKYYNSNKTNIASISDIIKLDQSKNLNDQLLIADVPAIISTKPITVDLVSVNDTIEVSISYGGSSIFNASAFNNSTFG